MLIRLTAFIQILTIHLGIYLVMEFNAEPYRNKGQLLYVYLIIDAISAVILTQRRMFLDYFE
jgi:heme/copper-type cytochrome/quinol oxidase subunit 4